MMFSTCAIDNEDEGIDAVGVDVYEAAIIVVSACGKGRGVLRCKSEGSCTLIGL